jgi:succinate-semialdehyde dehydrogenase / glutarate-semialdehyde dehydrogenase
MSLITINPYTEKVIKEYQEHTSAQVSAILAKSYSAFNKWKNISFKERAVLFIKLIRILLIKI